MIQIVSKPNIVRSPMLPVIVVITVVVTEVVLSLYRLLPLRRPDLDEDRLVVYELPSAAN